MTKHPTLKLQAGRDRQRESVERECRESRQKLRNSKLTSRFWTLNNFRWKDSLRQTARILDLFSDLRKYVQLKESQWLFDLAVCYMLVTIPNMFSRVVGISRL